MDTEIIITCKEVSNGTSTVCLEWGVQNFVSTPVFVFMIGGLIFWIIVGVFTSIFSK